MRMCVFNSFVHCYLLIKFVMFSLAKFTIYYSYYFLSSNIKILIDVGSATPLYLKPN
ncbi:hypothetical protein HanIR_Chr07g0307551 [Helianthus annuus]|nr:hypothetical protein HanIR_Chr07g0307551 [Helianthus annuus]